MWQRQYAHINQSEIYRTRSIVGGWERRIVRRSARPVTFFCRRVLGRKTASIGDFEFCIVRHCVEGGIQGFMTAIDKKLISLVLCRLNWVTAPKRFNNLLVCRSRFILRSNLHLRRLRSCVTGISKTPRYDCTRDFKKQTSLNRLSLLSVWGKFVSYNTFAYLDTPPTRTAMCLAIFFFVQLNTLCSWC